MGPDRWHPACSDTGMDAAAQPAIDTVTVTGAKPAAHSHFWAGDHFSFHDVLDTINPLQHLPIISTIYHAITGDRPGNVAEIAGDALYGGLLGLASGVANVALKEATGRDFGDTVMSLFHHDTDAAPEQAPDAAPGTVPATPAPPPAAPDAKVAAANPPPADPESQAASTKTGLKPLQSEHHFIPIDVSAHGIAQIRATSAAHSPTPVSLELPPGTMLSQQRIAMPTTAVDFTAKMREGLDKYDALLAKRVGTSSGASVDEIH